jgi:succinate dehydrogenase / fumarate reductase, flavoprotein subunit
MLIKNHEDLHCDVLVIGGGGAGLRAAIAARSKGAEVLLVSKTRVGTNTNTYLSKAVIASAGWGQPEDDESVHIFDTVTGGRFLNDQSMVAAVAERVHTEIRFLQDCGVQFEMRAGGRPRVIKTAGHRYPRHVHGVNWVGSDLVTPLTQRAKRLGVRLAEHVFVTRLIADGNRIAGATGIDADGRFWAIQAKAVVLATGGYAQVYRNTNNVPGITGDGQALAYDLGVALKDMEFVQFYPTAMGRRGSRLILYERILAQPGVRLCNGQGQNILEAHGIADPTTVTRDRLAQVIYHEMGDASSPQGEIFLDTKDLPEKIARQLAVLLPSRWWTGEKTFKVVPTTHFCMGGVVTDRHGETSLKGLFALGEVAAGAHGANRLGGNALAEIFTMGAQGGETAAHRAVNMEPAALSKHAVEAERYRLEATYAHQGVSVKQLTTELKTLMWTKAGVVRHERGLSLALNRINADLPRVAVSNTTDLIRYLELENMRCVAQMVCRAGLERTESRGSHFRNDFPEEDNQKWLKNIVLRKTDGGFHLEKTPVSLDLVKMTDS